jgi:hypothetical protein
MLTRVLAAKCHISAAFRRKNYNSCSFERGLELLFLTIDDPKNWDRLCELTSLHEVLAGFFVGENQYGSSPLTWRRYFPIFDHTTGLTAVGAGLTGLVQE